MPKNQSLVFFFEMPSAAARSASFSRGEGRSAEVALRRQQVANITIARAQGAANRRAPSAFVIVVLSFRDATLAADGFAFRNNRLSRSARRR